MFKLPHLFLQDTPFSPGHYSIIFIAITLPFLFCASTISRIGHRLGLIDNPNIRSSHFLPTPRSVQGSAALTLRRASVIQMR